MREALKVLIFGGVASTLLLAGNAQAFHFKKKACPEPQPCAAPVATPQCVTPAPQCPPPAECPPPKKCCMGGLFGGKHTMFCKVGHPPKCERQPCIVPPCAPPPIPCPVVYAPAPSAQCPTPSAQATGQGS